MAGYVRGGRSRAIRPVLLPGNAVKAEFRARTEEQLAGLTVELEHSRAPLMAETLQAAAIDWACALTAVALPEGTTYPALHQALDGVLGARSEEHTSALQSLMRHAYASFYFNTKTQ